MTLSPVSRIPLAAVIDNLHLASMLNSLLLSLLMTPEINDLKYFRIENVTL